MTFLSVSSSVEDYDDQCLHFIFGYVQTKENAKSINKLVQENVTIPRTLREDYGIGTVFLDISAEEKTNSRISLISCKNKNLITF